MPEPIVLEDQVLRASFDPQNGALATLLYKPTGWVVQRRAGLGRSFRLHAPIPHRRDNYVLGEKQRVDKIERTSENSVRIQWKDLQSEHGGVLPITLISFISLENGVLTFDTTLDNDSPLTVETLECPCLGDLSPPENDKRLWHRHIWYANLESHELYPHFYNEMGYYGTDYPIHAADASGSLFCLIQAPGQGVYVDFHDPTIPYFLQYTFEQRPSPAESITNHVAWGDEIDGVPSRIEFRATHFVFAPPHSSQRLSPITLTGYKGDWQAGVDIYKTWRGQWFNKPDIPDWAADVHSWQQIQINSPEEEYRIHYRDLPQIGEECARHGVKAIQLVGWNLGGQDRGNPTQDTDPNLGTRGELKEAIRKIQAMGVQVVLFGKFMWSDKSTDAYRKSLHKLAATDPYGEPYEFGGYQYHTPTQLAGINTRRFAVMCTMCDGYCKTAAKEFDKVLALEPAGFLYDEICHHGGVKYCFNPNHGHPVPAYVFAGDPLLFKAIDRNAPSGEKFIFAGEGPEDVLMQYYPLSYFRIGDGSEAVCRYIDSHAPLMVAVTGFDDREMLNRILMHRYVISYEPYCFKGRLGDFPLTLEYGKKIDALRRRYRKFLWDAEYRDKLGASVSVNGGEHRLYSVFRAADGKRAVVVVNQDQGSAISAKVSITSHGEIALPSLDEVPAVGANGQGYNAGGWVVISPEDPDPKPYSNEVSVPARSAAVVIER